MGGKHDIKNNALRGDMTAVPAMTPEEAVAHVTATNPLFEVIDQNIRGTQFKVFKNIPPHVRALLQASRAMQGDGAAEYLIHGERRFTYDDFCNEVKAMAAALEDMGLGKDDRIAVAMRNCHELLVLICAISSIGAIVVFLNGWWTTDELEYALEDSGATDVFADEKRMQRLRPLRDKFGLTLMGVRNANVPKGFHYRELVAENQGADWSETEIDADDDFAVMYSSGTTGHPKGVVQTQRGVMNAVFTWLLQFVMMPLVEPPAPDAPEPARPVTMAVTPLFHVTATHPVFFLSIAAGAKLVLMEYWDAELAVHLIRDEEVTRFMGVPTQSADLIAAAARLGETLPSLTILGSGGAKRPPAQVSELIEAFPQASAATGWGMTETNALGLGAMGPEYHDQPGVAGRLHPPLQELKLLDDDGQEVPLGAVGEITVKSPANMRCYLNKPQATEEVLQDGWLKTGDMAKMDETGLVTIVDRKKNIIIRGGENIACLDVEGALHKHPAVAEACAFAMPDERLGEVVGAAITLRQPIEEQELRDFLHDHVAYFKIPERIWFQNDPLPRGATDKIDRRVIQQTCLGIEEDD